MKDNDDKVKHLREVVDKKKRKLGDKPSTTYKTNLKYLGKNILTLSINDLVEVLSDILYKIEKYEEASKLLGVEFTKSSDLSDYRDDVITRGKYLQYNEKVKELEQIVTKLNNLRSEDLKKKDELADLESLLRSEG